MNSSNFMKDSGVLLFAVLLGQVQGAIIAPIILRTIGAEGYGSYVLLISTLGLLFPVLTMGSGFLLRRYIPALHGPNKRSDLFYPQFNFQLLIISASSLLLFIVLRSYKTEIYNYGSLSALWGPSCYLLSYLLFNQGLEYFRYTHRILVYAKCSLLQTSVYILTILTGFFTFPNSLTLDFFLCALIGSFLAVSVVLIVMVLREIRYSFLLYKIDELKKDISLGFPMVLNSIVDIILNLGDRYVIGLMLTLRDVGAYSPAYTIGSLIVLFPKVATAFIPPVIIEIYDSGGKRDVEIMLQTINKIFLALCIPFFGGALLLGEDILELYAGGEVTGIAHLVIPIVAFASIFFGLNSIMSNILVMELKTKFIFKVNLVVSIGNILFNFLVMLVIKSIVVAAIITALSFVVIYVLYHKEVDKRWSIYVPVKEIVKIMFASLVMGGAIVILGSNMPVASSFVGLALGVGVGVLIYCLCLYYLKVVGEEEIDFLKKKFYS